MYYSSNSTLMNTFAPQYDYSYNASTIASNIIKKIFDRRKVSKNRIKECQYGYNTIDDESLEKMYLMVINSTVINKTTIKYEVANTTLDEIAELKENWNGNGAKRFSAELVSRSREIANMLPFEPFISPTACGSIQMEYEKENGEYLEFEIYNDRVEIYQINADDSEQEEVLRGITAIKKMIKLVVDFYG